MKTQLKVANNGFRIAAILGLTAIMIPQTAAVAQEAKPGRERATTGTDADPPPRRQRPGFGPDRMRDGRGPELNRPGGGDRPRRFDGQGGPGGPRQRGFGPPMVRWEELTDVRKRRVEDFIKEHFPSLFVELQRLEDRNPNAYERRMARIGPRMMELAEMARMEPQRGALAIRERQLDLQIRELARDFRHSSEDQGRRRIRKRMRELCSDKFDCQLDRRALEVGELEARLAELKERLAENKRMREELINRIVKEVLDAPPRRGPPGRNGPGDRIEKPPPDGSDASFSSRP